MLGDIRAFLEKHMRKGKGSTYTPARLQAALALLEKLRDRPSLNLADHLASKGSAGLESHETFGNRAHKRLNLRPINKNHGRRSSSLQDWGQELLDLLHDSGFQKRGTRDAAKIIDEFQSAIATPLRAILEQDPLEVRVHGRSAENVIHDALVQAEEKGKSGEVAQYLVGAKLEVRLQRQIDVVPANKADRKSRADRDARLGDFEIENAVIEVAVGLPDEFHVTKIADATQRADTEVWLLTREDRVGVWKSELQSCEEVDARRVVVVSVEAFVGQNITELGGFSNKGKMSQLQTLFDVYNTRWIGSVGIPGMRIVIKK